LGQPGAAAASVESFEPAQSRSHIEPRRPQSAFGCVNSDKPNLARANCFYCLFFLKVSHLQTSQHLILSVRQRDREISSEVFSCSAGEKDDCTCPQAGTQNSFSLSIAV
jgi:hypothetical protein